MENTTLTRVLVITANQATTEGLRQILKTNLFEVFEIHSQTNGIQAAGRLNPDVVVLDLLSPGRECQQIYRDIRAFSKAPILVLSPLGTPEIVAHNLDQGADDYLLTPAPGTVIIAHLKKLARRARAERAADRSF